MQSMRVFTPTVLSIFWPLGAADTDWARKQLDIINTKSPTSSAVALRQMRDGAKADLTAACRLKCARNA